MAIKRRSNVSLAGALALAALACLSACTKQTTGSYQGYVEGEFVYVGAGTGGRLEHLLVHRGDAVEAKAPLFSLEATEEEAAVRQAKDRLAAAGARLADLGSGKRVPEIEVIEAQLAQAQAKERRAATQLDRDTAQLAAGGISQTQLDESHAQHEVEAAHVRELSGQLQVAKLAARPEQIRAQDSEVAAAQAALDEASWRLDQKRVAASAAGSVVDTLFREGEWVAPGAPVVRMLPPENVKVRFFVPEPELAAFPIGHRLQIRCDGCARALTATVSYRSNDAEFTPPVIYSNDMRSKLVFMIEAQPAAEDAAALHPGQPVEIFKP